MSVSVNVDPLYNPQPTPIRASDIPGSSQGIPDSLQVVESLDAIRWRFKSLHAEMQKVRMERDELESAFRIQTQTLTSLRDAVNNLKTLNSSLLSKYQKELESARFRETQSALFLRPGPLEHDSPTERSSSLSTFKTHGDLCLASPQSFSLLSHIERPELSRPNEGGSNRSSECLHNEYPSSNCNSMGNHSDPYDGPSLPLSNRWNSQNAERALPETDRFQRDRLQQAFSSGMRNDRDPKIVYNTREKKVFDIELKHRFVHTSVVCCIRFSPDGVLLAVGSKNATYLYNVQTATNICILSDPESTLGHGPQMNKENYIRSVKFSPDGKILATGSEDGEIRLWDIHTQKLICTFEGHSEEIYSLDFSQNGRYIVSGSLDKTMRVWDLYKKPSQKIHLSEASLRSEQAGFVSVAISPDSKLVAAGFFDKIVRIYDIEKLELIAILEGHRNSVYTVTFTPDGKGLITGSLDKQLKHWDITAILQKLSSLPSTASVHQGPMTNCPSISFKGHDDYILCAAVTTDSRWIISGSKDRTVRFWDARDAVLQFTLQGHKNSVIALHTSPLGGMFATGSGDGIACIWTFAST